MTVKELIRTLESYGGDTEVIMKACNSNFADYIDDVTEEKIDNQDVLVLISGGQV